MFNLFSDRHAYERIPDKCDEESREDDDNHNHTPVGTSTNNTYKGDDNMRFRGDKRLIERGGDFHQSTGKIALRKKIKSKYFRALYGVDLFHSLVDAPTTRIIGILMGTYMSLVVVFALIYWAISRTIGCNLDIVTFGNAFAFSLETMATIGYSTTDIFFDDCPIVLTVLAFQICVKLISDAVTIGVLYCKLSRPHARASTVIFSNSAVIRRIRGKLYFMFQLCELRKHQLVEAHVRVYVVRNEIDLSACFESDMYNEHPDEVEEGSRQTATGRNPLHIKQNKSVSSEDGSLMSHFGSKKDSKKPINQKQYHTLPSHHLHHSVSNTSFQQRSPPNSPSAYQTHSTIHNNNYTTHDFNPNYIPPNAALVTQYSLRSTNRPSYMQTSAMRLNHPNDELGGMLLLMTPQVVVHEIDAGSPLMPPPVWYCNFAYDEVVSGASGSGFKPTPFGPSGTEMQLGSHQAGDCIRWRPPAYRQFIHYVPAEDHSSNSGRDKAQGDRNDRSRASKGNKQTKVVHRYNADVTADNPSGYVPPAVSSPYSDSSVNNSAPTEPMWYYDAESLSRIDFPSVTRRIDTDNIAPNTVDPGNHNHTNNYEHSGDEESEVVDQSSDEADTFDANTTYVSHSDKHNTTAASHLECDYSMTGLASERSSPHPSLSNDPSQGIVHQNSHKHHARHTPTTHANEDHANKALRFRSAGLSSYADLLNHMSPSPQHNNNNMRSHFDLSPLRSPSNLNSANTSINSNLHKSMYVVNKPHSSLLVPILQAAPEPLAVPPAANEPKITATSITTATTAPPVAAPTRPEGKRSPEPARVRTSRDAATTMAPIGGPIVSTASHQAGASDAARATSTVSEHSTGTRLSFDLDSNTTIPIVAPAPASPGGKMARSRSMSSPNKVFVVGNDGTFASAGSSGSVGLNGRTRSMSLSRSRSERSLSSSPDKLQRRKSLGTMSSNSLHSLNTSSGSISLPAPNDGSPDKARPVFKLGSTPSNVLNSLAPHPPFPPLIHKANPKTESVSPIKAPVSAPPDRVELAKMRSQREMYISPYNQHRIASTGSGSGSVSGSTSLSVSRSNTPTTPTSGKKVFKSDPEGRDPSPRGSGSSLKHPPPSPPKASTAAAAVDTSLSHHAEDEEEEEEVCVVTDETMLFDSYPPKPPAAAPAAPAEAAMAAPLPPSVQPSVQPVVASPPPAITPPRAPPATVTTAGTDEKAKKGTTLPYPLHRSTGTTNAVPPPGKPTLNPFLVESGGIATSDGSRGTPKQRTDGAIGNFGGNAPGYVNYGATNPLHQAAPDSGNWSSYTWQEEEQSMVQRYLRDRQVEIIVIVEGVDAATGGMVQARHSYTSSEIMWDKSFECCVEKDPVDGCTTIDFSKFHQLCDVPSDAPFAGVVHSSI